MTVVLDCAAVAAFEEAISTLLPLPDIAERYDANEFWSLMASLLGTLPIVVTREEIERRLTCAVAPPDSLVVLPLANVAPLKTAIEIGPLIIGPFGSLTDRIRVQTEGAKSDEEPWWASTGHSDIDEPMILVYRCRTQHGRALHDAEQAFDDALATALALEPDLDTLSLYSLRGDTNRPGTRGLVLDRGALMQLGKAVPQIQRELSAPGIVTGGSGRVLIHRWNSESPFPVEKLLSQQPRREAVQRILTNSAAVYRRLRVAARWYAKAHWALDEKDAVLALGICFDAMLSERGPSPGRVLADRYAFLASDPVRRRARYREFQTEFFPARSSVAHGAERTSIDIGFVRRFAREAASTFRRILELSEARDIRTEDDYDAFYASLKWGDD